MRFSKLSDFIEFKKTCPVCDTELLLNAYLPDPKNSTPEINKTLHKSIKKGNNILIAPTINKDICIKINIKDNSCAVENVKNSKNKQISILEHYLAKFPIVFILECNNNFCSSYTCEIEPIVLDINKQKLPSELSLNKEYIIISGGKKNNNKINYSIASIIPIQKTFIQTIEIGEKHIYKSDWTESPLLDLDLRNKIKTINKIKKILLFK